jgi:NAD(P)-dependent dehydrogenase (short-subunit alcohol dehydrogenase family)
MIARGKGGSIIATSSGGGIRASYGVFAYEVSKHGLVGMTRCLAAELAPYNIRVNTICPGAVSTPMTHNDMFLSLFSGVETGGTLETADLAVRGLGLLPTGWLEPRDISNAVCFLASDEARYITGIEMPVDLGTNNQPSGIPPIAAAALSAANARR